MHFSLRACGLCYLKDFDLAAGRVQVLHVLSAFILFKGVYLDTEWNSFFSAVFPRGELCTDAVNLHEERGRKKNQRGTTPAPEAVLKLCLARVFAQIEM